MSDEYTALNCPCCGGSGHRDDIPPGLVEIIRVGAAPGREPADRYRHKKSGGIYELVAFAEREADQVPLVVYRSLDTLRTWVRPLTEWREKFEYVAAAPPKEAQPAEPVAEAALRRVLDVVNRCLPPDGISHDEAITEIIAIVDPWPLAAPPEQPAEPVADESLAHPKIDMGTVAITKAAYKRREGYVIDGIAMMHPERRTRCLIDRLGYVVHFDDVGNAAPAVAQRELSDEEIVRIARRYATNHPQWDDWNFDPLGLLSFARAALAAGGRQ